MARSQGGEEKLVSARDRGNWLHDSLVYTISLFEFGITCVVGDPTIPASNSIDEAPLETGRAEGRFQGPMGSSATMAIRRRRRSLLRVKR